MPTIDVGFPLTGERLPSDHGYPLYSALSRLFSWLHPRKDIGLHPVRGRMLGDRMMALTPSSRITFRVPHDALPELLPLSGKLIDIEGHKVRCGVPNVMMLKASKRLRARLVIIKGYMESEPFAEAAIRQLKALQVDGTVHVGKRRTMSIKDKEIVGFELIVDGLSPEQSIDLAEKGIGGRRKMGCGIFLPTRKTLDHEA